MESGFEFDAERQCYLFRGVQVGKALPDPEFTSSELDSVTLFEMKRAYSTQVEARIQSGLAGDISFVVKDDSPGRPDIHYVMWISLRSDLERPRVEFVISTRPNLTVEQAVALYESSGVWPPGSLVATQVDRDQSDDLWSFEVDYPGMDGRSGGEVFADLRHLVTFIWARSLSLDLTVTSAPIPIAKEIQSDAAMQFRSSLRDIAPGHRDWSLYENWVAEALEYLFCPPLGRPELQPRNASGLNRRDFVMNNYAPSGIWQWIREVYAGHYVVVEAKNGSALVGKREVLQVSNYLSEHGLGLFALIFSRNGVDPMVERWLVREQWQFSRKMIVTLDDLAVLEMIDVREAGGDPAGVIRARIEQFRKSI